jgi:hypothetical protein
LCTPASLKIFSLLTLKAVRDVLKIPTILWSLVIIGLIALCTSNGAIIANKLFPILFIMATRPSMDIKDWTYFRRNIKRSIVMIGVYAIIAIVLSFILVGFTSLIISILRNWYTQYHQAIIIIPIILIFSIMIICSVMFAFMSIPVQYFALLFYLDRKESIWLAYKRALAMFWYNMPAIGIYISCFALLFIPISLCLVLFLRYISALPFLASLLNQYISTLYSIILICLLTNLYIKLVHDQYELYFPGDVYNE